MANKVIRAGEAEVFQLQLNEQYGRLVLRDSHEDLISLYESDGSTPNKWTVDSVTEDQPDPSPWTNMVFSMTFESPEPEPEPDPGPSTSPAPTPAPDSDREQDRSSWRADPRPAESPSKPQDGAQEQPQEEPQAITLTNGRTVLTAPDGLYWAGYKARGNSHKG